jgi:hypothetical protein
MTTEDIRSWLLRIVGRQQPAFWESRFDELADFNGEVGRGIQHTPEMRERMAKLQADYDAKLMSADG